jgi:glycopeptide antibiotics resistance protein
VGPASIAELLSFGDPTYNVLLFVPLGLAIGLIPPSRRMAALGVAAVILPFAIETTQLLATGLGRACQSSDIADNLTGLVIGLVIGVVARRLGGSAMGRGLDRSVPES